MNTQKNTQKKKIMKKILFLPLVSLLAAAPAWAEEEKPAPATNAPAATAPAPAAADFEVKDAYAFATAPGQTTGVVFFTIVNNTPAADKLTAVSTDIAASAELHTNMIEEDTVTMIKVDGYDVAPGQTLVLEPNGHHVMLMGLTKSLAEGQTFPVKLTFAKKGEVSVDVTVKPPGEQMPAPEGHSMDGMKDMPAHGHEEPQ